MENNVTIGDGEAGWVITRSTLNRNGVFITSGLYDSGYSGVMAGAMHVTTGPIKIRRGTRVAQFLLFKSESIGKYTGSYGASSEHDKKYI
jgi:deoxycytidine triphosphate deaminase